MCGRYTYGVSEQELLDVVRYVDSMLKFDLMSSNRNKIAPTTGNRNKIAPTTGNRNKIAPVAGKRDIYPTDYAPVIVSTDNGITLTGKKWGYPGIDGKGTIINAKAETVMEKRMFSSGINRHRAVIPASGFYEWNSAGEKSTFTRFNESVMYMAGFYDHFEGEDGYLIITTAANESMRPVHDRMPLILEKEQIESWLTDDTAVKTILSQVPKELSRECEYEQLTLF